MPVHRVPKAHLDEDLRQIEREGEQAISITVDDDHYLILTRYTMGEVR